MQIITKLLNSLLLVCYAVTVIDYCLYFFRQRGFFAQSTGLLLKITIAVHLAELVFRGLTFHHFPIANAFEAVSAIAFAISAIYLVIETVTGDRSTGLFIIGIVFILQLVSSSLIASEEGLAGFLNSPLFVFHTSFAVLSYSAFSISAIYGIFYLMLYHEIKYHHFGILFKRLTSLDMLGRLNFGAALAGFFCLTAAAGLGLIWGVRTNIGFTATDPKILSVFCTWAIYGGCVGIRKFRHQEGQWFVYFSIIGFIVSLISVAMSFMMTSFHSFG